MEGHVIDIFDELKLIHQSLSAIRTSMVKNDDIKNIVTTFVSEIKGELKNEIIKEVKEALTEELRQNEHGSRCLEREIPRTSERIAIFKRQF